MGGRVFHTDPRGRYLNDFDVHFYGVGWLNFSNLLNDNKGALAHVGRLQPQYLVLMCVGNEIVNFSRQTPQNSRQKRALLLGVRELVENRCTCLKARYPSIDKFFVAVCSKT